MADTADVANVLVSTIAAALLPGSYIPGQVATMPAGDQIRIGRGWPLPTSLDLDLSAQVSVITVTALPGLSRLTTRFEADPVAVSTIPVTLTTTTANTVLTLGGSATAGQVIGIGIGAHGYALRLAASYTPATAAAALAALVPGATVSGAAITLPTDRFTAAVVSDTTLITEIRRQITTFAITVWTYNPLVRDAIAAAIDTAMAGVRAFPLPDGSQSDIPKYAGSFEDDQSERANLWRRDLRYQIEYPTTATQVSTGMLFAGGSITPAAVTWGQT